MDSNLWVIIGAAAGNCLLLLWGYLRSKQPFQAHYLIDSISATVAALPALREAVAASGLQFTGQPVWWLSLASGCVIGIFFKTIGRNLLMKPLLDWLQAQAAKTAAATKP